MRKSPKLIGLLDYLVVLYPEMERELLFSYVLCGEVVVNGSVFRDPKVKVWLDSEVYFSSKKFVSRGGYKLDPVLDLWKLPVKGKVFLDAGSSTGGFTDALLQRGASAVHSVDVGSGQLDWKLRNDPHVIVRESTNIMAVERLDPVPDAAVADLSFRSLRGAASKILSLTGEKWMIALVKPQFEWLDPPSDFQGIVPDERLGSIIEKLSKDLMDEGIILEKIEPSSIRGRRGNQEYLAKLICKS